MKPVGKPDSRDGHVRFDERGWETGRALSVRSRAHPRLYPAERWVRSIKLAKLILFGEGKLSRTLAEFSALIIIMVTEITMGRATNCFPDDGDKPKKRGRPVQCRHRPGGLLKYLGRAA
jgi:hypothetical protein